MSLARLLAVLVVLAAVALPTFATPALAQDEDVPTVLPPVPREVTDRLPEDLQQRHPWVPNDAPWPWNMSIAQGSWQNSNGSVTLVHCGPTVASDNPYWHQEDMRYTRWTGGARCNVEMRAIAGVSRLHQWNGAAGTGAQLAEAAIGAQQVVPPNHGSGWQAYSEAYYTRTSAAQWLQIHLSVTLEIQPWGTGARWNTVPNNCTRDANIRIIHCQLWSVPFQHAPYPCPAPGRVGTQPGGCVEGPGASVDDILAHPTADPMVAPETPADDAIGDTTGVEPDEPHGAVYSDSDGDFVSVMKLYGLTKEDNEAYENGTLSLQEAAYHRPTVTCIVSFRRKATIIGLYEARWHFGGRSNCDVSIYQDGVAYLTNPAGGVLAQGRAYEETDKNVFSPGVKVHNTKSKRVEYYGNYHLPNRYWRGALLGKGVTNDDPCNGFGTTILRCRFLSRIFRAGA